jgi:hypothetical protein
MGGVAQKVGQAIGVDKKPKAPEMPIAENAVAEKKDTKADRMDEEQAARMRGARRRGRQLLSDARLGSADETLGGGNSLGQ